MSDAAKKLTAEYIENYMEKLFYFCLKKTGNEHDADDLTQDITLSIITALHKGTVPSVFSAWVWQIARNRYSAWAKEKHRRNESLANLDVYDWESEDERGSILDEMMRGEQLSLLRRELAFIKSDYRYIVVAHYLQNKSIADIASRLSLSSNAVQQRLHRARIMLKEGMNMAREFGKRSYAPEQITFVKNGRDGRQGQPWSIVKHLLYKNIFLETYENPETAEELALELGVALPYMEDELEFLVQQELLIKDGNKYRTNFYIVSRDKQRENYEANKRIQKPLTDKLCELIDTYIGSGGAKANIGYVGYENAKWALLTHAFDVIPTEVSKCYHASAPLPTRPDDGAWILTGYETIDWEEPPFVGQHGYSTYDASEIKKDVYFSQFKFSIYNLCSNTPEYLTLSEAYTLWLVCAGKTDACEKDYIEKLLKYGHIKESGGEIMPNVVVFDSKAEEPYGADIGARLSELKKEILDLLKSAKGISRGYVIEQALHDGWLKYDENTSANVGAFIYL